jgi:hypothetical protein
VVEGTVRPDPLAPPRAGHPFAQAVHVVGVVPVASIARRLTLLMRFRRRHGLVSVQLVTCPLATASEGPDPT